MNDTAELNDVKLLELLAQAAAKLDDCARWLNGHMMDYDYATSDGEITAVGELAGKLRDAVRSHPVRRKADRRAAERRAT